MENKWFFLDSNPRGNNWVMEMMDQMAQESFDLELEEVLCDCGILNYR